VALVVGTLIMKGGHLEVSLMRGHDKIENRLTPDLLKGMRFRLSPPLLQIQQQLRGCLHKWSLRAL
jgi:hypothetical protein